jgi:hypothetical protein
MCDFSQSDVQDTSRPKLEPDTESITTRRVANVTPLGPKVDRIFDGLGAELKELGLRIEKVEGWKDRGHPGTFEPRGVMFHHTASGKKLGNAPALGIVTHGRADLPGPLSNFVVGRDGTIYFVAAGRCYHAGEGGPLKGIPEDDGNSYLIGVECENDGLGEEWPEEQKKAIGRLFASLLNRMDVGPPMVIGHKEWTSRKIDPAGIDLDKFRGRVRGYLYGLKEKRR